MFFMNPKVNDVVVLLGVMLLCVACGLSIAHSTATGGRSLFWFIAWYQLVGSLAMYLGAGLRAREVDWALYRKVDYFVPLSKPGHGQSYAA
jgi:hypothetical protein